MGSSLLAFISLACCAIPYVFYFYGARIRKRSRFAYSGDDEETLKTGEDAEAQADLERARSYVSMP